MDYDMDVISISCLFNVSNITNKPATTSVVEIQEKQRSATKGTSKLPTDKTSNLMLGGHFITLVHRQSPSYFAQ